MKILTVFFCIPHHFVTKSQKKCMVITGSYRSSYLLPLCSFELWIYGVWDQTEQVIFLLTIEKHALCVLHRALSLSFLFFYCQRQLFLTCLYPFHASVAPHDEHGFFAPVFHSNNATIYVQDIRFKSWKLSHWSEQGSLSPNFEKKMPYYTKIDVNSA